MVVLPYKDALVLFSKYLQQLIMESLGKRLDLDGNEVCQGISVYGLSLIHISQAVSRQAGASRRERRILLFIDG